MSKSKTASHKIFDQVAYISSIKMSTAAAYMYTCIAL